MQASVDSAQAVELCPAYAKAHYRKGMAILGISALLGHFQKLDNKKYETASIILKKHRLLFGENVATC